jgi:hypothetical protein
MPGGEQEQAPAACLPYVPRAQEVARKVAGKINHQLPDITVDHVGSTAVPGCAEKGMIDLRAFRDRLRANPEMMEAYVQRKGDIIEGGTTDALDYSIVNGSFVREALAKWRSADGWAKSTDIKRRSYSETRIPIQCRSMMHGHWNRGGVTESQESKCLRSSRLPHAGQFSTCSA